MRSSNRIGQAGWLVIALAVAACGGSPKQADDASSQPKQDDDTPKWDSSSTTTSSSSSSSGSSGSSDSSGSGSSTGSGDSTASSGSGAGDTGASTPKAGPNNEAEIALKRAARQAKGNCGGAKDADGKATGPFGKSMVTVILGRNGHSKSATVDSSLDGKPAGKCVIQAFSNLTYAPWAGADQTIQWEVELTAPK
ncbi:MAG TPA: hypothetical protein VF407_11905 [Polyangiaceae bacterium]